MVVNTYTQRERERETDRQPAKERLCEIEREKVKEVSSLVSGGSRRGHLKEILYPYIRSDGSDKKKKKILHRIPYSTYLWSGKICLN